MANAVDRYKYETEEGNIFYAITDNDTALEDIRGTPPDGDHTENMTCTVSKNNREFGIRPRMCLMERTITGTGTLNCLVNEAQRYKRVVILTPDQVANINVGKSENQTKVTVNGAEYGAIRIIAEKIA